MWELNQHLSIAEAKRAASGAAFDGRLAAGELNRRMDSLLLINMAMWSILEQKLGVTEEELSQRITDIDLRDGKLDGRVGTSAQECPTCGRVMSVRHQRCMYCGQESLKKKIF